MSTSPPLQITPGGDSRNKQIRIALYAVGGVSTLGCLAFIALGIFLFPSMRPNPATAKVESTRINMMLIGQGLNDYADAHNGRLPKAKTWMDDLEPYLPNSRVLAAPNDPSSPIGYALNAAAAEKPWPGSSRQIVIFEKLAASRNSVGDPLKDAAPRDGHSVVLLADGTVKVVPRAALADYN